MVEGVSRPFFNEKNRHWVSPGGEKAGLSHCSCFLRQKGYFALRIWEGKRRKYVSLCLVVKRPLRRRVRAATPDEAVWPQHRSPASLNPGFMPAKWFWIYSHRFLSPWILWSRSSFFFLNWSIVDLQCCVNFHCTAKSFSYTYICVCVCVYMYTFFFMFFSIMVYYRL